MASLRKKTDPVNPVVWSRWITGRIFLHTTNHRWIIGWEGIIFENYLFSTNKYHRYSHRRALLKFEHSADYFLENLMTSPTLFPFPSMAKITLFTMKIHLVKNLRRIRVVSLWFIFVISIDIFVSRSSRWFLNKKEVFFSGLRTVRRISYFDWNRIGIRHRFTWFVSKTKNCVKGRIQT